VTAPRRVADIDWDAWRARDLATLTFVIDGARVLLIRKKRGLGAGKISAPGGRLEPGESFAACAVREVEEELRITPHDVVYAGENSFHFVDGHSIHAKVYRTSRWTGTPVETAEAVPLWVGVDAIPYGAMWADDHVWVPHVLAGRRFTGRFVFDGDAMLDYVLDVEP
jgi:8-oxo-dGTP diphosphatase